MRSAMKWFSDPTAKQLVLLRVVLHIASLLPLVGMVFGSVTDRLGDSPTRVILSETGEWALYFLCITLAVTPLRRLTSWNWLVSFRRLPGMYAFFYSFVHFGAYLWLRRSMDFLQTMERILTRPAMLTGFIALVILLLLAATSTRGMFSRLGVKGWQWLHRLTYVAVVLAVVHYWLEVSRYGSARPLWFGALVGLLLLFRVGWSLLERRRQCSATGAFR